MEKFKMKILLAIVAVLLAAAPRLAAQSATFDHNKDLYNQINSMECGEWKFSPHIYYLTVHTLDGYSGAKFFGGFKKSKSKVGQIMDKRLLETLEREGYKEASDMEVQKSTEMLKRETAAQLDRSIDLVYDNYKDEFGLLQKSIGNCMRYCLMQSKGEAQPEVRKLLDENEVLCEYIAYIHKQDPNTGLENSKRNEGYIKALSRMRRLRNRSITLVTTVKALYPTN